MYGGVSRLSLLSMFLFQFEVTEIFVTVFRRYQSQALYWDYVCCDHVLAGWSSEFIFFSLRIRA